MSDPKEQQATSRNSGCPVTKAELIEWFTSDGECLDGLINIIKYGEYKTYTSLWNKIMDSSFLGGGNNCWVSRSGAVWSCGFAGHDFLLDLMGIGHYEPEVAGWVRISDGGAGEKYIRVQGLYKPTKAQFGVINKIKKGTEIKGSENWIWKKIPINAPVISQYERYHT